jgi:hypothetical protein
MHANRILTLCNTHIDERIPGLRATRVPIEGGDVIVVRIPTSHRKPHMIKHEGLTDFWIRHDRQKSRMSMAEIRAAITATEDLEMKVEQFVIQRRSATSSGRHDLAYVLMATPLLLEDGRVDTADRDLRRLLREPPSYRPPGSGAPISSENARVRPTLRGVRAMEDQVSTLEVFRNGHVEFVLLDRGLLVVEDGAPEAPPIMRAWAAAELIRNFVAFVHALRRLGGGGDVYLFTLSIWNTVRLGMPERRIGRFGEGPVNTFAEGPHLLLDPIYAAGDEDPDQTTRRLTNRLWNAFQYEACPFFDAQGRFALPDR